MNTNLLNLLNTNNKASGWYVWPADLKRLKIHGYHAQLQVEL